MSPVGMDAEERAEFARWRRAVETEGEPCADCGEAPARDRGLCRDCLVEHLEMEVDMEQGR